MTATATAVAATGPQNRTVADAALNSARLAGVIDVLTQGLESGQTPNLSEFYARCLFLSRGIDIAVANNEQPDRAYKLPALMKLLCERKDTLSIQAVVMVVFISVKNACKIGWFSEEERREMFALCGKIESKFCSDGEVNNVSNSHSTIATVIERFYPWIKISRILTSFHIKPGYGAYTNDFHILKKMACSPADKIRLIVVHVDNLDTSACIISPQQVSFVINGKGVERRTTVYMDSGPQLPTHVTPLLKFGTNLLQAVGDFKGNYLVVVAFLCEMPLPDPPVLLDYVQSHVDGSESDPDLIEGPSRISLNCPISRSRIKLPVKGHSCKHLQCFDFKNFVNINLRKPSWRCPHCNQYVCYTDIRIDQNIAKVLKEVADNVNNVIIYADGSWKAVLESDKHHSSEISLTSVPKPSDPRETPDAPNSVPVVVDLTDDCAMDLDENNYMFEIEDTKPSVADLLAPLDCSETIGTHQTVAAPPIDDEFFVGLDVPSGLGPTSWSEHPPAPALEPSGPVNFHAAPLRFINPVNSNEYGSVPAITRSAVSRVPIAVQALPAQTPGSHTTRPTLSSLTPNLSPPITIAQAGFSDSPSASGFDSICSDLERQQLFARASLNQPQITTPVVSSPTSSQNHHSVQNHRDRPFSSLVTNTPYQAAFNPRLSQQLHQLNRQHSHADVGSFPILNSTPNLARVPPGWPGATQVADNSIPGQDWRPTGRMRGSLSGKDCSHLMDQIIQPTQPAQPPRPSQLTRMPQMPALLDNHRTAHGSQPRSDGAQ